MKKLIIILLLMTFGINVYSQKSYVNIYAYGNGSIIPKVFRLSGDIPSSLKEQYVENEINIGYLLNELSKNGYEVEFVSAIGEASGHTGVYSGVVYLLSKITSASKHIQLEKLDDDSEVYEVARYNLQGMPINKNEKGVQIVVYSNNYSTFVV